MSVRYRISAPTAWLMGGTALFWDLVSIIPWLGGLISWVFGWGTFLLWFHFKGVGFWSTKQAAGGQSFVGKKLAAWFGGMIGEGIFALVGLSGVYPGFLITVILMIRNVRKEDEQIAVQEQAQLEAQKQQEEQQAKILQFQNAQAAQQQRVMNDMLERRAA